MNTYTDFKKPNRNTRTEFRNTQIGCNTQTGCHFKAEQKPPGPDLIRGH